MVPEMENKSLQQSVLFFKNVKLICSSITLEGSNALAITMQMKYANSYSSVCTPSLFGSSKFVTCYGLLGLFIASLDIIRILDGGPVLPEKLWGRKLRKGGTSAINPRLERDLKLMVSVIEVEHYTLMICGALNGYPVLLLPWLLLQFFVIMFQCLFYLARIVINGIFINKSEFLTTAFMIHNWLHVFCLFQKQISNESS